MIMRPFRFRPVAAALALTWTAAGAAPLGQLKSISAAADGHTWDIVTDRGAHVQVGLPRPDVLHIQASPTAQLTGPGDKAAPIVVGTPDTGT